MTEARCLRRALVRAAVAVELSLITLLVPLATFAWVLVPLSLFECWCAPRVRTSRGAVAAAIAFFVLAFAMCFYTCVQVIYFFELVASHSPADAWRVVVGKLEEWALGTPGGRLTGTDQVIAIVSLTQAAAIGLATSFVRRLRLVREWKMFFGLVLLVPAIDWIAYGLLRGAELPALATLTSCVVCSLCCSLLLVLGGGLATAAASFVWEEADELERWLWPRSVRDVGRVDFANTGGATSGEAGALQPR